MALHHRSQVTHSFFLFWPVLVKHQTVYKPICLLSVCISSIGHLTIIFTPQVLKRDEFYGNSLVVLDSPDHIDHSMTNMLSNHNVHFAVIILSDHTSDKLKEEFGNCTRDYTLIEVSLLPLQCTIQRIVYYITKHHDDYEPSSPVQDAIEQIAMFTGGSPDIIAGLKPLLLSYLDCKYSIEKRLQDFVIKTLMIDEMSPPSLHDVYDVYRRLLYIAHKWRQLAVFLEIKQVDNIHANNPHKVEDCLLETLGEWKKGNSSKPYCWDVILDWLKYEKEDSLANEIFKENKFKNVITVLTENCSENEVKLLNCLSGFKIPIAMTCIRKLAADANSIHTLQNRNLLKPYPGAIVYSTATPPKIDCEYMCVPAAIAHLVRESCRHTY